MPKKNYSQTHLDFCILKTSEDDACYKIFRYIDHVTSGLISGFINDIIDPFGFKGLLIAQPTIYVSTGPEKQPDITSPEGSISTWECPERPPPHDWIEAFRII
ncbi:hypothetical protein ACFL0M_10750, partial [Thermodesulfobacteriota bacterium]